MRQYEPDDAEDSDSETRATRERARRDAFEREVDAELGTASESESDDERSWEAFWRRSTAANAARMRRAGLDPTSAEVREAYGRRGQKLDRGRPREEMIFCFGCDGACGDTFECAQCLEIYRVRSKKVAFDTWERAFFCSCECYVANWDAHKCRHAPSTAGPTLKDGNVHKFESPIGNGALWHATELRRVEFEECVPPREYK